MTPITTTIYPARTPRRHARHHPTVPLADRPTVQPSHHPTFRPSNRPTARIPLLTVLLLVTTLSPVNAAVNTDYPAWWTARSAVSASDAAADYAVCNSGQLKYMALQAMREFDATLPGGAGITISNMVNAWINNTANAQDYSAINAGQLKAVAAPFYDRLKACNWPCILPQGMTTAQDYPWSGSSSEAQDYSTANNGQVKYVFSFSVLKVDIVRIKDSHGRLGANKFLHVVNATSEDVFFDGQYVPVSLTLPSGYPKWSLDATDFKSGNTATYNITSDTIATGLLFLDSVSPHFYSVKYDCNYANDVAIISAYPAEERSISFSASSLSGPKAAIDAGLKFIFPDINVDGPKGKLEFKNSWKECPNSYKAYCTYKLSAGFDPIVGAHAKFPIGAGAVIPSWITSQVNAGFYLKLEGKLICVGMVSRDEYGVTSGSCPLTGKIGGSVGYEVLAGGPGGFISMILEGSTSFTGGGNIVYDSTVQKLVLKNAKVNWNGVVANVTINVWWGQVEYKHAWPIISPPTAPIWGPTDLTW